MKALTSVIFKNDARKDLREDSTVIEKLFAVLSFIIVFGTVAGTITWASIYITKKLIEMNQPFVFIEIMLIGNFAILFFESIFQVLNSLYFSNDLKSILRMPINARSIIHAKLLKLITSEYQMETIMLAIPMTVYGVLNGVGIQFYLYIPIMLVVLPIIPICIITIIVALIMRFTNSIKNKSKVMYLTIIIAFLIVNFLSIIFGGNKIGVILVQPIINSIENYNVTIGIKNISYYVLASFITYIFTLIVTAPIYIKGAIGTVINAEKIKDRKEITINDFNEKTYKKSYLLKEFLVLKRSPIFFIQCIIMPIIMTLAIFGIAIALLIVSRFIDLSMMNYISNKPWFAGIFLAICQSLYMMNFSSIIAISKEKRWAILSKYIPIKLSRQINIKLYIGKTINFIALIDVMILYYICTDNFLYTIGTLVIGYILSSICEKLKIIVDLRNPKIDWDSEYKMMKQDTNVMYELFYTIVVMGIAIGLGIIIQKMLLYLLTIAIITTIVDVYISKYITEQDTRIFEKLY